MLSKLIIFLGAIQFAWVQNVPKVYVLGDSISIHYGPYLKQYLGDDFYYFRKGDDGEALKDLDNPVGANGGDSRMVLNYIKELLTQDDFETDYFLLNCGLHDIKTKPETGMKQVNIDSYESNLDSIFILLRERQIRPLFVNTTPVIDTIHNKRMPHFFRYEADVERYNEVASRIAVKHDIPVIDLNTFTNNLGADEIYSDHVHFREEVRKLQAAFITGFITKGY